MTMGNDNIDLTGIAEKGFIRFSIKAEDTPLNKSVQDAFKEFCKVECNNDYTDGLRRLLEYYQSDAKFEVLWDYTQQEVRLLNDRLQAVEQKLEPKKENKEDGVF